MVNRLPKGYKIYGPFQAQQITKTPAPLARHAKPNVVYDPYLGYWAEKRVEVLENWFPTRADGTIEVQLTRCIDFSDRKNQNGWWRVSAWG